MEYSRYEEPGWRQREALSEPASGSAMKWLLVGAGIGAGMALLFAPTSGRELREMIGRGCRRTFDGISRGTQELRQRGSNLLNFNRWRSGQKVQEG
jgi:gas vesicle protein